MAPVMTGGNEVAMRPAEQQANDLLRTAWHRSPDCVGFAIPVDPFYIAQQFGIKVVSQVAMTRRGDSDR
jgi:hypothetical protein